MIILNHRIKIKKNYVTWILATLLFILKPKIYDSFLMMLKNCMTHLTTIKMIKGKNNG